jgi:hypothetical protein
MPEGIAPRNKNINAVTVTQPFSINARRADVEYKEQTWLLLGYRPVYYTAPVSTAITQRRLIGISYHSFMTDTSRHNDHSERLPSRLI